MLKEREEEVLMYLFIKGVLVSCEDALQECLERGLTYPPRLLLQISVHLVLAVRPLAVWITLSPYVYQIRSAPSIAMT